MRIYLLLMILVLVVNTFSLISPIFDCISHRQSDDDVVINERKLQALRKELPPLSTVGFFTDGEITQGNLLRLDNCRRFYMTQYALAPNIVLHNKNCNLVVGSFTSTQAAQTALKDCKLRIVKDFGEGVLLLSAPEKQ